MTTRDNKFIVGLSTHENKYAVNGITYIVRAKFEKWENSKNTLRSRFEHLIKNCPVDLTDTESHDITKSEYISAAQPLMKVTDGKEQNEKSSQ